MRVRVAQVPHGQGNECLSRNVAHEADPPRPGRGTVLKVEDARVVSERDEEGGKGGPAHAELGGGHGDKVGDE